MRVNLMFCFERPLQTSEFSQVLHLRQNVNNITRAEQHGASGLIATHAQFFDADSHGGGPEIPHEDECEKFGPSSAYWPPKRATRAYSRWLVYLVLSLAAGEAGWRPGRAAPLPLQMSVSVYFAV